MKITTNLTKINRTIESNRKIEYIVIHYFGSLGSAKQVSEYFKTAKRQASAHYCVDDTSIYQCVEDKDAAWHCGDRGLGLYKSVCKNYTSIGIEVRPYKLNTNDSMFASDKDWYFHDKTIENVTYLVNLLMDKYNIDVDHVIRHFDVTNKLCPRPFVGDDINLYYKKTGNEKWLEFKEGLGMTQEKFNEMMNTYLESIADKEASAWSKESREWAEETGIIFGTSETDTPDYDYKVPVTREQMVIFLKRLYDKLNNRF